MNFADAIRAAQGRAPRPEAATPPMAAAAVAHLPGVAAPSVEMRHTNIPEPPNVSSGSVVRIELFLSGEQMTSMLKALMAGQHSVMTVREAAAYLRVAPTSLVELAESGEVPGLLIDGKWRFPKNNLDEWMALQSASRLEGTEDQDDHGA